MSDNSFFQISKEQSRVKAAIVSRYFEVWANVMVSTQDKQGGKYGDAILYLDLFAGPGRYEDGITSTPLLVVQKAIENPKLRNRLMAVFNDKDESNTQSLQASLQTLPGIDTLHFQPRVYNREVGTEIVNMFEQKQLVPTFFFVDPWGYKGLSLRLINSVLKNWGCDCVFFFNYNRINMGLPNEAVEEPLNALFGKERADNLRAKMVGLTPAVRELTIVEELCQAIKDEVKVARNPSAQCYVLPFRFRSDTGNRTTHHLIFVSKDFLGYEIMKGIMAGVSSEQNEGIASFEYNPATERQPFLFQFNKPLDDLEDQLLAQFTGRTLTCQQVYEQHNVDTPYVKKNYKEALSHLESYGKIGATPVATKRPKRNGVTTFGDNVVVRFP